MKKTRCASLLETILTGMLVAAFIVPPQIWANNGPFRVELRPGPAAIEVRLTNTSQTKNYEILSKTNLNAPTWKTERQVPGLDGASTTFLPTNRPPTVFYTAREIPAATNAGLALRLSTTNLGYPVGSQPLALDRAATVENQAHPTFAGGQLTLSFTASADPDDRIAVSHVGNGPGQIGINGAVVAWGGVSIGTMAGGVGLTPLQVLFNSNATATSVTALLRAITFENRSLRYSRQSRAIRFDLTDGQGARSVPAFLQVDIACPGGVDVVVVFDVSFSLPEPAFLQMKRAATNLMGYLNPAQDRVGLVTFYGSSVIVDPLTNDFARVRQDLVALSQRNGTVLHPAISNAQQLLLANSSREALRMMLILTDGEMNPYTEETNALLAASAAKAQNIRIVGAGFVNDRGYIFNDFLSQVASSPEDYYAPNTASNAPPIEVQLAAQLRAAARSFCRQPNNPPVAVAQATSTRVDTPIAITLSGSDPDGDALSYKISSAPTHGALVGTPPAIVYSPAPGYVGPDRFEFRTDDGLTESLPAAVSIEVVGSTQPCPLLDSRDWSVVSSPPRPGLGNVPGTATWNGCQIILSEGDSFLVEATRILTVPAFANPTEPQLLALTFETPAFDLSATNRIRDTFEVALVDVAGRPLTFTIQGSAGVVPASQTAPAVLPPSADACFNHTEGHAPFNAPRTGLLSSGAGTYTLLIDVGQLAAGSTARLILRLANNDRDHTTRARITGLHFRPFDPGIDLSGSPGTALSLVGATVASSDAIRATDSCQLPHVSAATVPKVVFGGRVTNGVIRPTNVVSATLITNANDSRVWQEANVGTFAALYFGADTPGTRQLVVDRQLLDSGRFEVTNTLPAALLPTPYSLNTGGSTWERRGTPSFEWLDSNGSGNYDYRTRPDVSLFEAANAIDFFGIMPSDTIGDTVFDLGAPAFKAAVFPCVDHGPLPHEAIELTIYLSNDQTNWTQAVVERVWLEGWLPDSRILWDGFTFAVGTSNRQPFRYACAISLGPGALQPPFGDESELNGIVGLNEDFTPVERIVPGAPTVAVTSPLDHSVHGTGSALFSGYALADRPEIFGSPATNSVPVVTVNGAPVDALDEVGNFFSLIDIKPGLNLFEVIATDAFNLSTTNAITVYGATCPQNFASLGEVSASVVPQYGRTSFNEWTKVVYADLSLQNAGTYPIRAPFYVGVTRISDPTVKLLASNGVSADGIPYYDFSGTITDSVLSIGATSFPRTLAFHNPNKVQFTYDVVVLGQINRAPQFTTVPQLEAIVGKPYRYHVAATDPDGDVLGYSLIASPGGMALSPVSNDIAFQPAADQVGVHDVRVRADDNRGGVAEQHFLLSVINPPSNRPPRFVTTPLTDVRWSSAPTNLPPDNYVDCIPSDGLVAHWSGDGDTLDSVGGHNGTAIGGVGYTNALIGGGFLLDGVSSRIEIPYDAGLWPNSNSFTVLAWVQTTNAGAVISQYECGQTCISCVSAGAWTLAVGSREGTGSSNAQAWVRSIRECRDRDTGDTVMGGTAVNDGQFHLLAFCRDQAHQVLRLYVDGLEVQAVSTPDSNGTIGDDDGEDDPVIIGAMSIYHTSQRVRFLKGVIDDVLVYHRTLSDAEMAAIYAYGRFGRCTKRPAPYSYASRANDPDSDPLTYSLIAGPSGMVIDLRTGLVEWSPTRDQIGEHSVTIQVADGRGGVASQSYRICLLPPEGSLLPVVTSSPVSKMLIATNIVTLGFDEFASMPNQPGTRVPPEAMLSTYFVDRFGASFKSEGGPAAIAVTRLADDGINHAHSNPNGIGGISVAGTLDYRMPIRISFTIPGTTNVRGVTDFISIAFDKVGDGGTPAFEAYDLGGNLLTRLETNDIGGEILAIHAQGIHEARILGTSTTGMDDFQFHPVATFAYKIEAVARDANELRYSLVKAPIGMSVDPRTGLLLWHVEKAQTGMHQVEYLVECSAGVIRGTLSVEIIPAGASLIRIGCFRDTNFNGLPDLGMGEGILTNAYAYLDLNGNGLRDLVEPIERPNSNGVVEFVGLPPGNYSINWMLPAGWLPSSPTNGVMSVALLAGQSVTNLTFGGAEVSDVAENRAPLFASDPSRRQLAVGEAFAYSPLAVDPDGDRVAFDLLDAPQGMIAGPSTAVVWRPEVTQVGVHRVVLRVQDGRGGMAVQSWELNVTAPNTPPAISTFPRGPAVVGHSWEYRVRAHDAEKSIIAFALGANPPEGLTILQNGTAQGPFAVSGQSAILSWIPTVGQLGKNGIEIVARDSEGGESRQVFDLEVVASAQNSPPVFTGSPRRQARLNTPYIYGMEAVDPNGDRLVFTLVAGPDGMVLTNSQYLVWSPRAAQLGSNSVHVRVTDGRGGSDEQAFAVMVSSTLSNSAPFIVSLPPLHATAGQPYEYDLAADDPDGDGVTWRLVSGPVGMSIDTATGALRWNPTLEQLGTNVVVVEAVDLLRTTASQTWEIDVGCLNRPPQITSVPPTQAQTGDAYLYAIRGADPDGDAVTFAFADTNAFPVPFGMTISNLSVGAGAGGAGIGGALVRWTPTTNQVGSYAIRVRVSDNRGGSDTQTYNLYVADLRANKSPVIVSTPQFGATIGRPFTYTIRATDPDGDSLTFSALAKPASATLTPQPATPGTALIEWAPTAVGPVEFILSARDPAGASAFQRFMVTVRSNEPPVIVSVPRTEVVVGEPYRVDVGVIDSNGDRPSFTLVVAPPGMTIDDLGRIVWDVQPGQQGIHPVELVVSDGFGGVLRTNWSVTVMPDLTPPQVALTLIQGSLSAAGDQWTGNIGQTIRVRVDAVDNTRVTVRNLFINGVPVPLSADFTALIPADQPGQFRLAAFAQDLVGNTNMAERSLLLRDPHAINRLFAQIDSPSTDSVLTAPANVTATMTNDADIVSYTWGYALASEVDSANLSVVSPTFTIIGSSNLPAGTRSVANLNLGRFDPTLLNNDSYVIAIEATDARGNKAVGTSTVGVRGDLKFGELKLDFTDLAIPVAGIPIQIKRVYDSRLAGRVGDFGHGWALGLRDANIRVGLKNGTLYPGSRVTLTTVDGRRVAFTADHAMLGGGLFGSLVNALNGVNAQLFFRPDPGVYDRLELTSDGIWFDGAVYSSDSFGGQATGIDEFSLRGRDGTQYDYSATLGLRRIADLNQNRLEYTSAGIFHYSAGSSTPDQAVRFVRDSLGRITQIIDPAGKTLVYGYDSRGDLASFSDLATNITRYRYDTRPAHFLTNIVDFLGRNALRAEFEAGGRLAAIYDAQNNPIRQAFDLDSKKATFTDGNGNTIETRYDDAGNEVVRTIVGVATNYFAYDANNNLLASTNGRGFSTNYTYDARGNVTSIRDSLGNLTTVSYNELSKPAGVTNALGQQLILSYNSSGQLTQVVNNAGFKTSVSRDAQGRVSSLTDATGTNTTIFDYTGGCACGRPGKVINPDGSFRLYEYTVQGLTNRVVNELGAETLFHHDDAGRVQWVRDPLTNFTYFFYNGPLLTNVVDALGRSTRYEYDALNRTNRIIDAEGGVVEFRYDNNGNRTAVIDPVGNVTRFIYDAGNRLVQQVDPLGHTNFFAYDAAGNRVEAIDRNGRKRTFRYDVVNRMTNELWWEGTNVVRSIVFGFNELGVQTLAADPAARYEYRYDTLNRLERVLSQSAGVPDFTLLYTYTSLGQVESVTDNWGVRVGSAYDNRNRLASRTWQGPGVDPARVDFAYDVIGNRVHTDRFADLGGINRIGSTTNAYNHAGVVTNITHLGPASQVLAKYDYVFDSAYQIRSWTINNQPSVFDYDRTGQLTNAVNAAQPNENFRYDANGSRIGAQSSGSYTVGGNNQILSDGTNNYAYDFEGNMASRSNTVTRVLTTYQWDHRNRLTTVLDRNPVGVVTQTVAFFYDAINRRLAKTVNGQVQRFLYNQDDSWVDLDGANAVTARYLHGTRIDELLARQRAGDGRGWYLTDHLGSVRDIANATGTVITRVDYSGFGKVLAAGEITAVDRFRFTGREFDAELMLSFYRARYFSPNLGRFISYDPIDFSGGDMNLYRYVENKPTLSTDPTGESFLVQTLKILVKVLKFTKDAYKLRRDLEHIYEQGKAGDLDCSELESGFGWRQSKSENAFVAWIFKWSFCRLIFDWYSQVEVR